MALGNHRWIFKPIILHKCEYILATLFSHLGASMCIVNYQAQASGLFRKPLFVSSSISGELN